MTRTNGHWRWLWAAGMGCLLWPLGASAADAEPAPKSEVKPVPRVPTEFDKYALVLLRRGPKWSPQQTPESERIQQEHLGHLRKMWETGKLVVAGPFSDQPDPTLRGLCLYRVDSLDEARRWAQSDPAVQAGRLAVEAMTWYVEKGYLGFPKSPPPKSN